MTATLEQGKDAHVAVKKLIAVRLPDDLLKRIDAHRERLRQLTGGMEPTRSDTIKFLLERGIETVESESAPKKKR